jgi:hypothetical protein
VLSRDEIFEAKAKENSVSSHFPQWYREWKSLKEDFEKKHRVKSKTNLESET